ncbi:MAG: tetratricopeptide repeat protein [Bacteroidales bacterium]
MIKQLIIKLIYFVYGCLLANIPFDVFSQKNIEFKASNFPGKEQEFKAAKSALNDGNIFFNNGLKYCRYSIDETYCYPSYTFYSVALPYFLQAYDFNPANAELNFKIAICYFHSPTRHKSLFYFLNAYLLNPDVNELIHYYLARAFHLNMKWEEALEHYNKHIKLLQTNSLKLKINEKKTDINKYIKECESGITITDKYKATITNLGNGINTSFSEYSPVLLKNNAVILFTSRRDTIEVPDNPEDLQGRRGGIEKIYCSLKFNSQWTTPFLLSKKFNKENTHNAILSIAPDGKSVLLYRNGDIYESFFIDNKWIEPDIIQGRINTSRPELTAFLAPDLQTIYYVQETEKNGKDIFVGYLDNNGICYKTFNIGTTINTTYDEDGLYVSSDGKHLFFSSKGHNSIGGYDVFRTTKIDSLTWSVPENLGLPVNSATDDVFFTLLPDFQTAYFSSERNDGVGELDIYHVFFDKPIIKSTINNNNNNNITPVSSLLKKNEILKTPLSNLQINVKDNSTKKIIEASIHIFDNSNKLLYSSKQLSPFYLLVKKEEKIVLSIQADGFGSLLDTIYINSYQDTTQYTYYLNKASSISYKTTIVQKKQTDSVELHYSFFEFFTETPIDDAIVSFYNKNTSELVAQSNKASKEKSKVILKKGNEYNITDVHFKKNAFIIIIN